MGKFVDFTIDKNNETVTFMLYVKFNIIIPVEDWMFLCEKRWFSNTPTQHEVEVEFGVCGVENATDNDEANEIVRKTIECLRGFIEEGVDQESRRNLDSSKRFIGHMDKDGNICFTEANYG